MTAALNDATPKEFQVPPGIELIPIDRRIGLHAQPGGDGVILEAFKAGTGPSDLPWFSDYSNDNVSSLAPMELPEASAAEDDRAYSLDAYAEDTASIQLFPPDRENLVFNTGAALPRNRVLYGDE